MKCKSIIILLFMVVISSVLSCEQVRDRMYRMHMGDTDVDIENKYGKPTFTYYSSSTGEDYYIKGWDRPPKSIEIENKLYIYDRGEVVIYLYFNNNNEVVDSFVGGS